MPRYQITDSTTGRVATIEGDSPPTDQEASQIFASLPMQGGTSAPAEGTAQSSGAPTSPSDAALSAVPDQSWWDKVKTEIRESAPVTSLVGETPNQLAQRRAALDSLRNISPTLAAHVEASVPEAAKNFQREGAGKLLDVATQGGGAVAGAELGALGGPFAPITIPFGGALGSLGGNLLAQKRREMVGDQAGINPGEATAAAIAGAIPGGSLAKTGLGAIGAQALKQAAGGELAETTRSLIDEGKLPDMHNAAWAAILPALGGAFGQYSQATNPEIAAARTAAESKVAEKAGVLAKGQSEGMVTLPSMTNPSAVNKTLEKVAGKKQLVQQATGINQEVANDIARRVLDPTNPDIELSSAVTQAVRQRAYDTGYLPLTTLGSIPTDAKFANDLASIVANRTTAARSFPAAVNNEVKNVVDSVKVPNFDAQDGVKMIQILRNEASQSFANGSYELGQAQKQAAGAIESQLERHLAAQTSNPQAAEMLSNYRDARTLMAQSHDIEDAIREGGSGIIPAKLGAKFQAQAPLSGGLETIGGMANNFPAVTGEAARKTGVNVGGRVAQGATAAGAVGLLTHSPEAAALAMTAGVVLPTARSLLRNLILSSPYQRMMARVPVTVEANPDLGGLVIRQGAQAAAQGENTP